MSISTIASELETEKVVPAAIIIPTFPDSNKTKPAFISSKLKNLRINNHKIAICTLLSTFLVGLFQILGWMQLSELKMFDRLMIWRIDRPNSERILIVTVENADIQYQRLQGMPMMGSLADAALEQLLTKLQPYRPKVITSDIIHDFPYSPSLIKTIPLRSILQERESQTFEQLVAGKIILIGVKSNNTDLHVTPYSRNYQARERLSGAAIHAQMTDQIISAVLDKRGLLTWVPEWLEYLWLIFWSGIGATILVCWRSWQGRIVAISLAFNLLMACCWVLFNNNIWILTISPLIALLIGALSTVIYQNLLTTHNSTIARSDRTRVQW